MDIATVKAIGNMQNTFMFYVNIDIPTLADKSANKLEFVIRSTTVPEYRQGKNLMRFLNRQYNLPAGKEHDGEWSVTALLPEDMSTFNILVDWFKSIDGKTGRTVTDIKGSATVKLLGLDKTKVNKIFYIKGIFLMKIPAIDGLDMSQAEGHVSTELQFAYDEIEYDSTSLTDTTIVDTGVSSSLTK